ncbi:MAG: helix-turn-helix domain-containing protein [Nanoarchaeota archaeon]|nr:helix-turn-helix domain-containing protein [Nanoarchaeota archaeon]MBU1501917.1 helix-turn-helix domain-containing protein [Nanoarchaeota archaeon]
MLSQTLKQIGLTEGEIKVYLALIDLGSVSTGRITKASGISGSKVYEVLERLMKKGLVSTITKNNVRYFEATSPNKILDYLDEKTSNIEIEKTNIQKILPDLILKQNHSESSEVKVFTGFEGIKTCNEDIINSLRKGEEWLSMGLTEQPESWEIYFNKKQKERAKKGIVHKHLLNRKYKALHKERKHLPHTVFRFLSEELEMPTSTEIYKDKILIIIISKESPLAIRIENKAVANSFRKYFGILWKTAKVK